MQLHRRGEELAQLLEEPENLRLMNAAELRLHADQRKTQLYAEKEELFFAIDEKGHEADLTEKGRNAINPGDPDAFVPRAVADALAPLLDAESSARATMLAGLAEVRAKLGTPGAAARVANRALALAQ
mgnify:CR=1 FL=1